MSPDSGSSRGRLTDLFAELCDLGEREQADRLALLREIEPGLIADLEQMLAGDRASRGPFEALKSGVAGAAERFLIASAAAERPERLGPWQLTERLGEGGMGEVWAAERVEGGFTQRAAVKLVRAGMASREVIQRFAIERQVLARLEHPAIAKLLDGGVAPDGRPWFAMERVDGAPITRFAEERGLALPARLRLFLEVLAPVDFAHRSLVVHRDLKPSNILVPSDGRPKLLDFGLAKLLEPGDAPADRLADPHATRTEFRALTPAYAAPEQILGEPVTTATDVYSLGVILFELLTGELPHKRRSSSATTLAADVTHELLERPSQRLRRLASAAPGRSGAARRLEGDLDTIVVKALARDRERRYPSVAALAADLTAHLEGRPISARPDSLGYRAGKFVRRHRLGVAAAAAVAVSLVAGLAAAMIQGRAARREANRAERVQEFLVRLFEGSDPGQTKGESISARQLLEEGTRRIEVELADEPEVQVSLYDTLARIHRQLGALDESERLAKSAIALSGASLGNAEAEALARLTLAETLSTRFDFAAARREVEAILPRLVADHGADSEPVVRAKEDLVGSLPLTGGSPEDALRLAEEVHAFYARKHGEEHPQTARRLALVAIALKGLGRFADSEKAFARATETLERTIGADNPETAEVRRYRAMALDNIGRFDEAVVETEKAVAALEKSLGSTHPMLARSQSQLALLYSRRGRKAEAEGLFLRCATTLANSGSREEGDCLRLLGDLLVDLPGRAAEAEDALRRAVAILAAGDERDPYLLAALASLGNAQAMNGKLEEGEKTLREAISRTEIVEGTESDFLRRPLTRLGEIQLRRGGVEEAIATLRRAFATAEKNRGAASPQAARVAESLAAALSAAGGRENLVEAARLIERAGAIYLEASPTHERLEPLRSLSDRVQRQMLDL